MTQGEFRDKVVIVTGASSGIGRELALQLARQGAFLALASRNEKKLDDTAQSCMKHGGRAIPIPTDVSNQADCRKLVEQTTAEYGRLDALINNAGVRLAGRFDEIRDMAVFEHTLRVNFLGSVYCTFYTLPWLKKSRGRLVGIASLAGKWAVAERSAYSASKHAMVGFFDSLRAELVDEGVSVTIAYPGFVATETCGTLLGPDGQPIKMSEPPCREMIPTERCAQLVLRAAGRRSPEVVIHHSSGRERRWAHRVIHAALRPFLTTRHSS